MTTDTVSRVTRQDVSLVRHTLYRRTAVHKLVCAAAISVGIVAAWLLGKEILAFGNEIDYSSLHMLGEQNLALLQEYNPFFWWGIAVAVALLILYLTVGFVAAAQRRARSRLISQETAQQLVPKLSHAGRAVLTWSWEDTREPITVGVLQRTLTEMRGGRAARIALARQHASLLDDAPPNHVAPPASTTDHKKDS
ncbi:MAG TPA: hypothetical protein VK104_07955 [Burkholderiaceae bacterium]|nr:hypothetical protein [Burkholderiaceae bacterium]